MVCNAWSAIEIGDQLSRINSSFHFLSHFNPRESEDAMCINCQDHKGRFNDTKRCSCNIKSAIVF